MCKCYWKNIHTQETSTLKIQHVQNRTDLLSRIFSVLFPILCEEHYHRFSGPKQSRKSSGLLPTPQSEQLLLTQLPTVFQVCSFSPPPWSLLVLTISSTQDAFGEQTETSVTQNRLISPCPPWGKEKPYALSCGKQHNMKSTLFNTF